MAHVTGMGSTNHHIYHHRADGLSSDSELRGNWRHTPNCSTYVQPYLPGQVMYQCLMATGSVSRLTLKSALQQWMPL